MMNLVYNNELERFEIKKITNFETFERIKILRKF